MLRRGSTCRTLTRPSPFIEKGGAACRARTNSEAAAPGSVYIHNCRHRCFCSRMSISLTQRQLRTVCYQRLMEHEGRYSIMACGDGVCSPFPQPPPCPTTVPSLYESYAFIKAMLRTLGSSWYFLDGGTTLHLEHTKDDLMWPPSNSTLAFCLLAGSWFRYFFRSEDRYVLKSQARMLVSRVALDRFP